MNSDSDAGVPVLLTTVFDPVEAEIIVAKLRSAGIEAAVRHEALSVVYGLTVDGCGQQDILVRPADLDVARAVMEPGEESPPEGPTPPEELTPPDELTPREGPESPEEPIPPGRGAQ